MKTDIKKFLIKQLSIVIDYGWNKEMFHLFLSFLKTILPTTRHISDKTTNDLPFREGRSCTPFQRLITIANSKLVILMKYVIKLE